MAARTGPVPQRSYRVAGASKQTPPIGRPARSLRREAEAHHPLAWSRFANLCRQAVFFGPITFRPGPKNRASLTGRPSLSLRSESTEEGALSGSGLKGWRSLRDSVFDFASYASRCQKPPPRGFSGTQRPALRSAGLARASRPGPGHPAPQGGRMEQLKKHRRNQTPGQAGQDQDRPKAGVVASPCGAPHAGVQGRKPWPAFRPQRGRALRQKTPGGVFWYRDA